MTSTDRKVTIYDIARLSGASPSTVSAALSGAWKSRRIAQATVDSIRQIAADQGYSTNMQARGLRQARSGMVGMIIPMHDNRFFSSLSQSFEAHARERGLCPVIASTLRDPAEELRTVETLISYNIDFLFIAGATDPSALSELCTSARLGHVYVDLPGGGAPSVVTNNFHGAELLTRKLLDEMPDQQRNQLYLLGGITGDHATTQRIAGFRACHAEAGIALRDDQILPCGYARLGAQQEIAALCDRLGGLPAGLFVNSLTVFEGVLAHLVTLPPEAFANTVVGCYDYDPFAAFLQFPVHMIRQNSHKLIEQAYALMEARTDTPVLIEVEPDLIPPRTIFRGPFAGLG
ncbi:MAG: LacI family DNA-binding transcriptional regulator [Paracoccaceae bacterium]